MTLEGYSSFSPQYTGPGGITAFDFTALPNNAFGIGVQSTGYLPAAVYDITGGGGARTFYIVLADY